MSVGENTEFDIIRSAFEEDKGLQPVQETADSNEEPESAVEEGKTEEISAETTDATGETEEKAEANAEVGQTFDESKYLGEISGGMFNSLDELKSADVFRKATEFDQLRQKYDELVGKEPEEPSFVNDQVKALNDYISKGGDLKTFIDVVSADYDSMSDMDVMIKSIMSNYNFSEDQAKSFLTTSYNLDEDRFDEKEMEKTYRFKERIIRCLKNNEDIHYRHLQEHLRRHLAPFGSQA